MPDITITRLKPSDYNLVIDFLRFAVTDTFQREGIKDSDEEIDNEIIIKGKYLEQDINSKGKDRVFFIAKHQENVVGTIEYGPAGDLIIDNTTSELSNSGAVGTIYVHPDYQKQGIATHMLRILLNELAKREINYFCLDTGYDGALAVWTKMFGKPLYTLKDYWGMGGHHYIWHISVADTLKRLSK